jgi:hypothetical protein
VQPGSDVMFEPNGTTQNYTFRDTLQQNNNILRPRRVTAFEADATTLSIKGKPFTYFSISSLNSTQINSLFAVKLGLCKFDAHKGHILDCF